MIVVRYIAASALAFGVTILALAGLQSAPAEARGKGVHGQKTKAHGVRSMRGRPTPGQLKSTKTLTTGSKTAGVGKAPSTIPIKPNGAQTTAGAGSLPHTPPINPGGGPPTNPSGGPKGVPLDPAGGPTPVPVPIHPKGNLPHTPPINPGGGPPANPNGGPYTTPFDPAGGPAPVPVPSNPNGGRHNGSGSQQKHIGAYVEPRFDDVNQCWRLKQQYDQMGNIDWLIRYRQCLSWHYSD